MLYVTREAELDRTVDGVPFRVTLDASAKKGNQDALAKLALPEFPESMAYLHEWFRTLSMGRGEGMHGVAPLTYASIDAWARLSDELPEPHEVKALLAIDVAYRVAMQPAADEKPKVVEDAGTPVKVAAWPAKKVTPRETASG